MDRSAYLFIVVSVLAVVGVAMLAFPMAAMSPEKALLVKNGQEPELFEDVDLGDFGMVSVLDMMQHYVDNPPVETATTATKSRFQGC